MFNFLQDIGTFHQRKVAVFESDTVRVSTVRVSDGSQPFETAIMHPDYNDGKLVIVGAYDTREDAEAGHARWVDTMTHEPLPETLHDVANAEVAQALAFVSPDALVFPRKR